MGQKVHPMDYGLVSSVTGSQNGTLKKTMQLLLHEDFKIREFIENVLKMHLFLKLKSNVLQIV